LDKVTLAELAMLDPPSGSPFEVLVTTFPPDAFCMQVITSVTSAIAANQLPSWFDTLPHHTSDIMTSKNPFFPGF